MSFHFLTKRISQFLFVLALPVLTLAAHFNDKMPVAQAQDVGSTKLVYLEALDATISDADRYLDAYCTKGMICKTGDFNGDGRKDVVAFFRDWSVENQGDVYVTLATRQETMGESQFWHRWFCIHEEVCEVGDFNGDGLDDIVTFLRDSASGSARGDVRVALSNGREFLPAAAGSLWHGWFCIREETCTTGDINGDGKDDIIAFIRDTPDKKTEYRNGTVVVALSNGARFEPSGVVPIWANGFCFADEQCFTGDFNGDKKEDLLAIGNGVRVAISQGTSFSAVQTRDVFPCGSIPLTRCEIRIDDYNNDQHDDILAIEFGQRRGTCFPAIISISEQTGSFALPRGVTPCK